ncbi:MAG: hypothetical protein Q8T13_04925 [Acidobacteriota bacterium]|nr:hypothetical protein [Acidobacteriota bacterium]
MSGFSLEWSGLDEFVAAVRGIPSVALNAAGGSLYREGEDVMTESKELVPVDMGPLRDSGHVELPMFEPGEVSVTLGYGGAAQDYAVAQHEDQSLNHPNGGEAKFLETPLLRRADGMAERIGADIAHAIGAQQ